MLAEAFKEIRKTLGLTQAQMGKKLGITNIMICYIEKGKKFPSWKLIERCEKEFGINPYIYAWCMSKPEGFKKEAKQLQKAYRLTLNDIFIKELIDV